MMFTMVGLHGPPTVQLTVVVTVYFSILFLFDCAATTWMMFTMVGLHGPPPTVLINGDHWLFGCILVGSIVALVCMATSGGPKVVAM